MSNLFGVLGQQKRYPERFISGHFYNISFGFGGYMIRKSLAFLLIGFVLAIGGEAQTPAPGATGESRAFSMFFDADGGYLGIQTEEVTKANFAKYGLREVRGVAIEKVVEGSPAEKAGLQNGDVIARFNNEDVTSTRKLTRLLGEVAPDHQVKQIGRAHV